MKFRVIENLSLCEDYDKKGKYGYILPDGTKYSIWTEFEYSYTKIAFKGDNWIDENDRIIRDNLLGMVEYRVNEDEKSIYIEMIQTKTSEQRKGIATNLYNSIRSDYPDYKIDWGYMTDAGKKLYDKVAKDDSGETFRSAIGESVENLPKYLYPGIIDKDAIENIES